MTTKTYTRLQLASDVILSRLVLNTEQENFTNSIIQMEVEKGERERTRAEVGKAINDMLLISAIKHFDPGEDGIVTVDDLDECAFAGILKGMANYVTLAGRDEDWGVAFFLWVRQNIDPTKYNVNCDPNWDSPTQA